MQRTDPPTETPRSRASERQQLKRTVVGWNSRRWAPSRLGAPADELARDGALIRELLRLTEGEPLLVGLYADQLWDAAAGYR